MPPFEEDIHVVVFVMQRQWGIYALLALFDFSAGIKAGGERNRLRKFVLSGSASLCLNAAGPACGFKIF